MLAAQAKSQRLSTAKLIQNSYVSAISCMALLSELISSRFSSGSNQNRIERTPTMKERSPISAFVWLLALTCALAIGIAAAHAQNESPAQTPRPSPSATPTPSPTPTPVNWSEDPMLKRFVWRGIGPASMGGRIDDIAVVENNT